MPCAPSLTPASLGPQLPTQGLSHHQIFPCPQLDPAGLTSACHTCGQGPRLPQTCSSTWMCSGRGRMDLLRTTLGAAPTPPSNRLLLGAITSQPHQPSASPSLGPPTPGAARGPRPRSDHTSAWPRSAEAPQPASPYPPGPALQPPAGQFPSTKSCLCRGSHSSPVPEGLLSPPCNPLVASSAGFLHRNTPSSHSSSSSAPFLSMFSCPGSGPPWAPPTPAGNSTGPSARGL